MTPTLLQTQYGYDAATALRANSLAILLLTIGCIVSGSLSDRFGSGRIFVIGGAILGVATWTMYASLKTHPEWLFPLYALAGLSVGVIGGVPRVMVLAFPPVVRFSGLSFSYNLAYAIFGGLTPMVVTLMLKQHPLGPAYYVAGLAILGMLVGFYLLAQERRAEPALA